MSKETIFVGLSGGVDSSVSALRLKNQGHDVVGVFIKVWQPDFLDCDWESERLDAMRVAAHLDIPFLTFDAEAAYKREVADYMIEEYRNGRTPNPDVMCNQHVKFGAFLDFALAKGATKIATGHYAQILERDGVYILKRGVDTGKDQSYFLWTLSQKQLEHSVFPIGDTPKEIVRKEAEHAGIPIFDKNDSQGICFLGQVDIREFLSHYIDLEEGVVLNEKGESIGTHSGAVIYTLGQRHGFKISVAGKETTPHYVVDRDTYSNTITVSEHKKTVVRDNKIKLSRINQIAPGWIGKHSAQFRYRQTPFLVEITEVNDGCAMLTLLETGIETPPSAQSCVLYDGDTCIGGGIIENAC